MKSAFTHRGWYMGLPIYFNVMTSEMAGRFWLADVLIPLASKLDSARWTVITWLFPHIESPGFAIKLTKQIDGDETL